MKSLRRYFVQTEFKFEPSGSSATTDVSKIREGLDPRKTLFALLLVSIVLVLLHLIFGWNYHNNRSPESKSMFYMFSLASEKNFPATFSALLWLFAAALCWKIFVSSRVSVMKRGWLFICLLAFFFALDEFFMIHEGLSAPTQSLLPEVGFLHFSWVVPYGIAIILISLILYKFLLELRQRTRHLILLAGSIFAIGALGLEMLAANLFFEHIGQSTTEYDVEYAALYTLEETMEMTGVSIFIYALLDHLKHFAQVARVSLGR